MDRQSNIAKWKGINIGGQKPTQKTKDWATRTPRKTEGNEYAPEGG